MKKQHIYFFIYVTFILTSIFTFFGSTFLADAAVNPNDSRWIKNISRLSLTDDTVADYSPQIAISGTTIHVSWTGVTRVNDKDYYRLYYTRSTNRGITWETPRFLLEVEGYTNFNLRQYSRWMAVDGNNVHIFISKGNYPTYPYNAQLLYFRSTDGGVTFGEPQVIDSSSYSYNDIYEIYASASNGKVVVSCRKTYRDKEGNDWHAIILATSSNNGNSFNVQSLMEHRYTSTGWGYLYDMQMSGDKIYVMHGRMYCYAGYGDYRLYISRTLDFGQTIATTQVYEPPSNATMKCVVDPSHNYYYSPRIAIDGNRVYIVYYAYNSEGKPSILFRRSTDNGVTFQNPINLTSELPEGSIGDWWNCSQPEYTVAARSGKVYVVLRDQSGDYYCRVGKLYMKRSLNGGSSFQPMQELTTDKYGYLPGDITNVKHPIVMLDPRDTTGSTVYVFAHDMFFTYSTNSGGNFTAPVVLFDFDYRYGDRPSSVHPVIGSNGEIHMVTYSYAAPSSSDWVNKQSHDIYYRAIHPLAPTVTPQGNRALSLTMYYGDPSGWDRYDSMLISSSQDLEFTTSFTIEFWAKALINGRNSGLFLAKSFGVYPQYYSYYLGVDYYKRPYVEISTTSDVFSLSGNETFPHDQWTHFAVTFDSSSSQNNLKLYMNGKLVGQKTVSGTIVNSKSPIVIGGIGSIHGWYGLTDAGRINMDELRFWNRALSEDEIRQNMRRYLTGTEFGLVAYYNFDEPLNRYGLVRDITGSGNKGYLIFNEILVAGVEFPLRIITPNGGESINAGSQYKILWQAPSKAVKFKLYYSTDNKTTWNYITEVGNVREYTWQVPAQDGRKPQSFVRVVAMDSANQVIGTDDSDKAFAIEVLRLTSPNGGEPLKAGNTHTIIWQTYALTKTVARVQLQYSTDNGQTWINIATLTGNPGRYNWKVPNTPSNQCRVRIILRDNSGAEIARDTSDNMFTIEQ